MYFRSGGFAFFDGFLHDLRGHGIVYLVCIAVIVGAFKFLDRHPQAKKFALLGAFLILGAGLGGAVLVNLIGQVMLGSLSSSGSLEAWATWGWVSGVLYFLIGAANAAGIASLAWAVFVERIKVSAKKVKRKPTRRSRDDDDDDDEDEDDRPRRRRRSRDDDDDD